MVTETTLYVLRDAFSGAIVELFGTAAETRRYLRGHSGVAFYLEAWSDSGLIREWNAEQLAVLADGSAYGVYV